MAAGYTLYLCDAKGRQLMPLTNLRTFRAGKIINGTAPFGAALKTPSNIRTLQKYNYVQNNIRPDWTVQVWQKTRGAASLWNTYFVLNWGWAQGDDGNTVFSIGGYDHNHLLTRRIVAAYAESVQAQMTDYADDMMKQIITNSMEDDALPVPTSGTRAWDNLTVQGDKSNGPSISMAFSWAQLLTLSNGGILPKIANASREEGTDLFFWIVPNTVSNSSVTYEFRTYTGQPGQDLTTGSGKVIFDADAGTLENWSLSYDYSEAVNYVYGLGQGLNEDRTVQQAYEVTRYKRSIWGRCEGKAEARMSKEDDEVTEAANDALAEGREKIRITGKPVSVKGQQFGRHYNVGDKVVMKARGVELDALVWSGIVAQDEDGRITEDVNLKYYD